MTRTRIALLILVSSCTPMDPDGHDPEIDGKIFLVDEWDEAWAERALIQDFDGARMTPTGAVLEDNFLHTPFVRSVVVVDPGPQPRIAIRSGPIDLLLYVDRTSLRDVTTAPTVGTANPFDDEAVDGSVLFEPGVEVEIVDAEGDRVLVHNRQLNLTVEAWVPARSIDQVFRPRPEFTFAPHEGDMPLEIVGLLPGSEILDRPHGTPMAWIPADDTTPTEPSAHGAYVMSRRDHHLQVHMVSAQNNIEVLGWVHDEDLSRDEAQFTVSGSFGGFDHIYHACFTPRSNLLVGTWLYDEPDGHVVGRTNAATHAQPSESGWGRLGAYTPWGDTTLWVRPEALDAVLPP